MAGSGFGGFYRTRRRALDLTLREYCRRNGFDPANISRLERGLAPPPLDTEILKTHAKGLKLDPDSVNWEKFMELAASHRGQFPADILESSRARKRIPGMIQTLRGPGHRSWVRALKLQKWADLHQAQATLPRLVRRLIWATGKDIRRIEFPAGEQVQRPGWDGWLEAGGNDAFVPEGVSVWELSVNQNSRDKANKDFEKREKDALGLEPGDVTFIFVTPRKWQDKGKWITKERARGLWKDVRVYDSANLEEWLEQAPSVDAWFAECIGEKPQGVTTLDDHWANLQNLTDPSLKPEVFLASREEGVDQLTRWLEGSEQVLNIEARSPADVLDFIAAYGQDPVRADRLAARALIVETREAWRNVASATDAGLLLIPHPKLSLEQELVAEATRKGHRVILPVTGIAPRSGTTIILRRPSTYDITRALKDSGFGEKTVDKAVRNTGRSLTILKRVLAQFSGTANPEWSRAEQASRLTPLLLAGSWDGEFEADRSALARLADRPYREIVDLAARWESTSDPPLALSGTRYRFLSLEDAWRFLATSVSPDQIERFEKVAIEVLGENDPALELPPVKRINARIRGIGLKHSHALREGLAETLAILGANPNRSPKASSVQSWIGATVTKLLKRQDKLRWASLGPLLPLLAEAAPDGFLEAADGSTTILAGLFDTENASLRAWVPGSGLLTALKVLAWDPAHLSRACQILAKLDDAAPDGPPGTSLLEILSPWFPGTASSVDDRVKVLKKLAEDQPNAAWRLLEGMLKRRLSQSTVRPRWRDWSQEGAGGASQLDFLNQIRACECLILKLAGNDVARWVTLIGRIENLSAPAVQQKLLDGLERLLQPALDEESRRRIADALREKEAEDRRFRELNRGGLVEDVHGRLEKLREQFEPRDVARQSAWLFKSPWQAMEEQQRIDLDKQRRNRLREILECDSWPGVLRLVEAAEAPEVVGQVLAEIGAAEAEILPSFLVSPDQKLARFARGYTWKTFQKGGWEWVDRLNVASWPPESIARFLDILPFERETWNFADRMGREVAERYWDQATTSNTGKNGDDARYAAQRLIDRKRGQAAILVLLAAIHQENSVESSLLMDALEVAGKTDSAQPGGHVEALAFKELHRRLEPGNPDLDLDRLGILEWNHLEILSGQLTSPRALHQRLRDHPELFVEVIALAFRSQSDPMNKAAPATESETRRAVNAYTLLRSWTLIPGSNGTTIDFDILIDWIKKARTLAQVQGRLEICDSLIGEMLAHATVDPDDGGWPCVPVRDVLEEVGTDKLLDGLGIGLINERGMYSKAMNEGGAQERELSKRYAQFAETCQIDWPKTAAALRKAALFYTEEARREDILAEVDP